MFREDCTHCVLKKIENIILFHSACGTCTCISFASSHKYPRLFYEQKACVCVLIGCGLSLSLSPSLRHEITDSMLQKKKIDIQKIKNILSSHITLYIHITRRQYICIYIYIQSFIYSFFHFSFRNIDRTHEARRKRSHALYIYIYMCIIVK